MTALAGLILQNEVSDSVSYSYTLLAVGAPSFQIGKNLITNGDEVYMSKQLALT